MAQTATFTGTPGRSAWETVKRPFAAYLDLMVRIAEAGPRMQAVRKLSAQTDADLAARGKTREGEVRRLFGSFFYL